MLDPFHVGDGSVQQGVTKNQSTDIFNTSVRLSVSTSTCEGRGGQKINGQAATSYPAKTRKADDSQLEGHRQGKSFDTTHVTYRVGLKWQHATKPALYKSVSLSQ